jgi:hypothetical protein
MAVIERCLMLEDANVHVIICEESLMPDELVKQWFPKVKTWADLPAEKFWQSSKALAESLAKSDVYVVLDDDHLPIGKDWLEKGLRAMKHHPEYGCLSSWSINGEVPEGRTSNLVNRLTGEIAKNPIGTIMDCEAPQDWVSVDDEWCWEATCTGTPYFIRKEILGVLPDGPLKSYDTVLSEHIRSKGHTIGFLREVRHNHLGYGLSQVIPEWWLA